MSAFADAAVDLLDAAAAALDAGPGAPARRFVSHAAPAWDLCEADQLTVHAASIQPRLLAGRPCQIQFLVSWHVQVVRCFPALTDAGPPSVDAMDHAAAALLEDLDALRAVAADPPFDCQSVTFAAAQPLGPLGAVAGWDWALTWAAT